MMNQLLEYCKKLFEYLVRIISPKLIKLEICWTTHFKEQRLLSVLVIIHLMMTANDKANAK